MTITQQIENVLRTFPWGDYGLDIVSDPDTADEWVKDLTARLHAQVADLEADSRRLRALYGAGVDDWEGYDYAMQMLREEC